MCNVALGTAESLDRQPRDVTDRQPDQRDRMWLRMWEAQVAYAGLRRPVGHQRRPMDELAAGSTVGDNERRSAYWSESTMTEISRHPTMGGTNFPEA